MRYFSVEPLEDADAGQWSGESFDLPPKRWLLRSSIPEGLDVFGVEGANLHVVSERFVEVLQRLGPADVTYQELPAQ